jgi:hypothetical protein
MRRKKTQTNVPTSFLQKTFEILGDNSLTDIVSWTNDGKAFAVKNVKAFCEEVLPKYFKHNNYASFVRQLNMYDFHKLREEENVFRHNLFQRDKQHLLKDITRKTAEGNFMPNTMLSKTDCTGLLEKLFGLNVHQQNLERQIMVLQQKYTEIRLQNQMLIKELYHAKEREQRIEKLLVMLASFISKRPSPDFNAWRHKPMLTMGSPSSPEAGPELLESDDDPIEYLLSR